MSSLDRLIKLAKKTGDRLIVHNPIDETDIVIMDVSEYENLLDEKEDVRGLSERQLLNQINRDISIWRANDKLESEYEDDALDFVDDKSDWHSAGSVLDNRDFGEPVTRSFSEAGEGILEKENDSTSSPQENTAESSGNGLVSDDEPVFYEEPV